MLCIISLQHDNMQSAEMRLFTNLGFAEVEKKEEKSCPHLSTLRQSIGLSSDRMSLLGGIFIERCYKATKMYIIPKKGKEKRKKGKYGAMKSGSLLFSVQFFCLTHKNSVSHI